MKYKLLAALGIAISVLSAQAWHVSGVVRCPNNGATASGIVVFIGGVGFATTDSTGAYLLDLPDRAGTYTICVEPLTIPGGANVSGCVNFTVDGFAPFATVNFDLGGPFCGPPEPEDGQCWLTGGGTVGNTKGKPIFSFGGVVNPGCSPTAAGGGNWNVIDHVNKLHFKGLDITVTGCSGSPTGSPQVNVNIIDFEGTGTLEGLKGNPLPKTAVCFTGRAVDNRESGRGRDTLFINVRDCTTGATLLQISNGGNNPVAITTGNLQIHTTGCEE